MPYDDELLLDPVRRFLDEQCTLATLRAATQVAKPGCRTGPRRHAGLWSQICQLGWPRLLVAEKQGGIGMDMIDAVGLMELAGRALLPLPLGYWMSSLALLTRLAPQSPFTKAIEADMLGGSLVGYALNENGGPIFVPYCLDASPLITLRYADGIVQARRGAGMDGRPGVDPLIDSGWLPAGQWQTGEDFSCDLAGWAVFDLRTRLLLAAELLGVAARALELATDYARQRRQFGHSIGHFQAIKHGLAQDWMNLDNARLLIAKAAEVLAFGDASTERADADHNTDKTAARSGVGQACHGQCSLLVMLAEHATQQAADIAVRNALQVHGAMGMTWECDVHFYFKRVHFLGAIMCRRYTAADRLQQIWQLSETQMAVD